MKKLFPTKAYILFIVMITIISILICLFMPYAVCSHTLTVSHTESFDFSYMRRINSLSYDYIINMKDWGTVLDDVYWTTTQSGDYAIMNGRHETGEHRMGKDTPCEMGISFEVRCANLFDILKKRTSLFYESSPVDIFPTLKHRNLQEETSYIIEGEGWILYTSAPVELIPSVPSPLYLHNDCYFYIGYTISINILFIVLIILIKHKNFIIICKNRKSKLDPILLDILLALREQFPTSSIDKGNLQFSRYMSWRYNVWLPAYIGLYESLISLLGATGKIRFSFFLIGSLLSYMHYIVYTASFTVYKKGNSYENEFCRLTTFARTDFNTFAQWDNYNIFLRISEILYVDGKVKEARNLLETSWKSFQPNLPQLQISYYLLLCKLDLSYKQFDNIESNLKIIKSLLLNNEKQLKRTKKLYNLMNERYRLIEAAFLGDWNDFSIISENIKEMNSDPVELTSMHIIKSALNS